jgi:predicted GH43/DUF377 family glycosyl hydrolase
VSEQARTFESLFRQSINPVMEHVRTLQDIELVVGIPFYNEKDTISEVLQMIENNLPERYHEHTLVLSVGDPAGAGCLEAIRQFNLKVNHFELLMNPGSNGRGSSIRAIFEAAKYLAADVVLLAADVIPGEGRMHSDCINLLLTPLSNGYDMAVAILDRPYWGDMVSRLFTVSLLEMFYGCEVTTTGSGIYSLSYDLVEDCCTESKLWGEITRGFGADLWLITRAIRWKKRICEVHLGAKPTVSSLAKVNQVFKETAEALFECISKDEDFWSEGRLILKRLDRFDFHNIDRIIEIPSQPPYSQVKMIASYKRSHQLYQTLYELVISKDLNRVLRGAIALPPARFSLESSTWTGMVYYFLLSYWLAKEVRREDLLNALTDAFGARLASVATRLQRLHKALKGVPAAETASLLYLEADAVKEGQRADFLRLRDDFLEMWEKKASKVEPPFTPAYALEFVPGRPLVLPKIIPDSEKRDILTEQIFNDLQQKYQEDFDRFIYSSLQAAKDASSAEITQYIQGFMARLEESLNILLPGDIYTQEGTQQVVDALFQFIQPQKIFTVKTDILREMLLRFPPVDLMVAGGFLSIQELIDKMNIRYAASLANLMLSETHSNQAHSWLLDELRPDNMEETELKPLVLGAKVMNGRLQLGSISHFYGPAARILVSPLSKGTGGEYPKLRFCLYVARHIIIAEDYSKLWKYYAQETKRPGTKIGNSLVGHYDTEPFSAHNLLENFHQRALVERFRNLGEKLAEKGHPAEAKLIRISCDIYGKSQVLEDGTFIPCSAWTWASYSYKGGKGLPTPLSSHVEGLWFAHELLEEIFRQMAYDPGEIWKTVVHLIGEGRSSEYIIDIMLGVRPSLITAVVQQTYDYPPAKSLLRYGDKPLLTAVSENHWESKYVLNPAAFRIEDQVFLLYRAFGDDQVSRLGLAITDGFKVLERLPEPVFVPGDESEKKGVEDPRVVIIGDQIYMMYVAYDGIIAQIAAASIKVEDFLNRRFDRWERKGLAFQDIWDKDAVLFSEKINGRYVIYHRIDPSIWLTYVDKLEFPLSRERHAIIMGPRLGRMWDSLKIGAGSQPIKTKYGWLLIYHGVDRDRVYRLGVILADQANPERLLYRSPNPILSPETEHEIGKGGEIWTPNVVFTCGAVPAQDKEVLDAADEILVYYGAADTYICLATGRIGDLIPESIRQEVEKKRH